ncbi:hypothetical protein TIFTF001_053068 [Ficus carica]|uniref:Uncharacterized protein n=1 Tax=Ficus carica TaxID=3494 RepID=A0AA88JIL6_FICCA|nr:hypothetical protein TIFTF001_053068 [Ficus carica]
MLCLFFFAPFLEKEELYHPTFKRSAGGLLLLSQLESSFSICRLVRRVAPPNTDVDPCYSSDLGTKMKRCPTFDPHSFLFSLKREMRPTKPKLSPENTRKRSVVRRRSTRAGATTAVFSVCYHVTGQGLDSIPSYFISYLGTTISKSGIAALVQLLARNAANSLLRFQAVKVVYLLADKSGNEA